MTTFVSSFTKWDGFNQAQFVGLDNYIKMFSDGAFISSLSNLLKWSILAATVHVGFGTIMAFLFYYQVKGWKFVRSVFMIPNIISMAAWAVIFKFLFNDDVGIINRIIRVFSPNFSVNWATSRGYSFWLVTFTWLFFAVIVSLIVLNDLMAIPEELEEAASIDGASRKYIIFKIQLPLVRKAIGTSLIASITARVAMYESIALTTGGGPGESTMNLPYMISNAITDNQYGYANSVGVVMIIIGLLTLFLINKAFRMDED